MSVAVGIVSVPHGKKRVVTAGGSWPVDIDLLFLSRDLSPLRPDVWEGIQAQEGVTIRLIRITGPPAPGDRSRFETIARARNAGKRQGSAPLVMLLDDDVVLGPRCLARLAEGLINRPEFAALGADCVGEMNNGWGHWDYPRHVGMAAVMFRRERLQALTFRWEPSKCDCLCCCDDLRRAGHGIGYSPGAEAWHRPSPKTAGPAYTGVSHHGAPLHQEPQPAMPTAAVATPSHPGRVLTAFDRRHRRLFVGRFLRTLRSEGNPETVTAVTSGLRPNERRILSRKSGVEVFVAPNDGHPALRRLRDFQQVLASWPADSPVAYWDAGDVVFQDRIAPLWELVRANPDHLLVVPEAVPYRQSPVNLGWVVSIRDPEARARAVDLLKDKDVINAGFAAGTVRAMIRYLKEANRLLNSSALFGSTDWGDQTAMNLYCRSNPHAWLKIPGGWNYCLAGRGPREYRVSPEGRTERLDGEPLHVVHGAGGTLRRWDLVHLTA
jgi:hypothetical protein